MKLKTFNLLKLKFFKTFTNSNEDNLILYFILRAQTFSLVYYYYIDIKIYNLITLQYYEM